MDACVTSTRLVSSSPPPSLSALRIGDDITNSLTLMIQKFRWDSAMHRSTGSQLMSTIIPAIYLGDALESFSFFNFELRQLVPNQLLKHERKNALLSFTQHMVMQYCLET
jgi:hypothetical protein